MTDPIDRDIFQHELVGIAEEMSTALRRGAYSSIIWDMYDYATGLLDVDGGTLSQAQTIPAQLGIMPTAAQYMLAKFPLETWQEGDVYMCNDPYKGCTHTPDIVLFSPCFVDGRIVAIASTVAHHIDVGGKVPGTEAADSVELFEEGIVFPPVRLIAAGEANQALFDIFANNVRDPHASLGDLRAQIAGCRTGERRVKALCERHGTARFRELVDACADYAATYVENALRAAGDGKAEATILIEDDAATDEPLRLTVEAEIRDGRLTIDFSKTSAQRANGLNCPYASTISMVHYAVKAVFTPDLPQNEGCNRPVEIVVPEGNLLNPRRPAAVSVRHLTQQGVADAVLKALSALAPERSSAGSQIAFPTMCAGGNDDRAGVLAAEGGQAPYFVIADILGGGMGGYRGGDGMTAIDTHGGNCALLSAEVMETMSPLRVLRTELSSGSAGAGEQRGGLAFEREYEVLSSEMTISGYFQQGRPETAPWGLEGGGSGGVAAARRTARNGAPEALGSKFVARRFVKGERIALRSAGGGGWGAAETRAPEALERDRAFGYTAAE